MLHSSLKHGLYLVSNLCIPLQNYHNDLWVIPFFRFISFLLNLIIYYLTLDLFYSYSSFVFSFCFVLGFLKIFLGPLFDRTAAELDRKWWRERGNDMQERATGWNQTHGCCSEHTASVHEAPTLTTEQPGHPPLSCLCRKIAKTHSLYVYILSW